MPLLGDSESVKNLNLDTKFICVGDNGEVLYTTLREVVEKVKLYWDGIIDLPTDTENPSTPINFSTSVSNNNIVQATWTESTDDFAIQHYVIEYTLTSDTAWSNKATTTSTSTSKSITIPSNGTYKFRVKAVDTSNKSSEYSTESTETITIPLPASYTVYYGQNASVPDATTVSAGASQNITGTTSINTPFDSEVVHWFAIPDEVGVVTAYNSVITSDVLYTSESDNDYTKTTITIGGTSYSLYSFSALLPLGQDIIVQLNIK